MRDDYRSIMNPSELGSLRQECNIRQPEINIPYKEKAHTNKE
jgi:hypothetical protein